MEKSATQIAAHKSSPAMVAAEVPSVAMDLDNSSDPSSRGRKRALEGNLQIENSNYYKMRLILKDLRPHVLQILRTPDFRNSQAASQIQEKMNLMLKLYHEMIGEQPKREKTMKSESLSNGKALNQTQALKVGETVVGGSAFGWNFITYGGGTQAVYCGMSKEEYRISHPITQLKADVELH